MAILESAVCLVCSTAFFKRPHKSGKYCSLPCYRVAQRAGEYKRGHGPDFPAAPCSCCGKTVQRIPSEKRDGLKSDKVFCNRQCYDTFRTAHRESRILACVHCQASFVPENKGRRYCSEVCWKAAKKAKPKRCVNCSCLFTPVKLNRGTGRFISYNDGKTCSAACHNEWIRTDPERKRKIGDAFRGANHPNWQGGKSQLNNISNRGPNWKVQRERALRRDGYKCVDCSMTQDECRAKWGRGLDVDHVIPYHNFSSYIEANALSNLQCRCASCHTTAEHKRSMVQMVLPLQDSDRRRHKGYANGERVNTAKLSVADVRDIRSRALAGEPVRAIHTHYDQVGRGTLFSIISRKTWRHL